MIHTFQVRWQLNDDHLQFIQTEHGIHPKDITDFVKNSFESMTVNIAINQYTTWMSLIMDVPQLLNRGEVIDSDYEEIAMTIKAMLSYTLGDIRMFDDHHLVRFDYRLDKKVIGKDVRKLYIDLYKKTCDEVGRSKKGINKYEATMYHNSNSIHTICYDKEAERYKKGEVIKEWEKDILRFEVRLLESHLKNNRKKKMNPLPRKIESYFKRELFEEYVENYLNKTYMKGDFYTFENAMNQINTTTVIDMSLTIKDRMKEFVKKVSTSDLNLPKEELSTATFRSRMRNFRRMNLHPVTIPKTKAHIASFLPSLL